MRRIALVLSLLASAAFAGAEDVTKVATGLYAKLDAAELHKDTGAFEKAARQRITADYRDIDTKGKSHTFNEALSSLKQGLAMFDKVTESTSKITKVDKKPNIATITVHEELSAYLKGPDGKQHLIKLVSTNKDVWKLVGKQWRYASSTELTETTTMDGTKIS